MWFRANGELPDDPLLHVCAVTYASDMTLLDSVLLANGLTWDDNRRIMVASLDHAMWFHRPFRADDWLLYDQQSPDRVRGPRAGDRAAVHARRSPRRVGRPGGPAAGASDGSK